MQPKDRITDSIRQAVASGRPALIPFLTAGYPDRETFGQHLLTACSEGDVVEIGVPFTDPLADGVTIQRSSEQALENGVTLAWILQALARHRDQHDTPVLLMSYLNPLLSMGYQTLAERAGQAGVCGFIVPDLPYEESEPFRNALDAHGLALVQLVSPITTDARLKTLCEASSGFVYAVTVTGVTGGAKTVDDDAVFAYLDKVREISTLPVCAGFGIRSSQQVRNFGRHADGVIVGSALVEVLSRGEDPQPFLQALKQ